MIAGGVIILWGFVALGRRAAAPSVEDRLEEGGIYAYVRHPIYTGLILEFCGIILVKPTLPVLVACILGLIWVPIQARLEEIDLMKRLPVYQEYIQRVPRFLPHIQRKPQV